MLKGRPHNDEHRHLRDLLLHVTKNSLAEKSHLDLTSHEIAVAAGTNAAMVNYYFQSKDGLFSTLVEAVVNDISHCLEKIERDTDKGVGEPTEAIVRPLVETYFSQKESASILFVEIIRPSSPVARAYARRRGLSTFARVKRVVKKLVDKGVYRSDLNTDNATWTLLSLVVGPQLLSPVWRSCGELIEVPEISTWVKHIVDLVQRDFEVVRSGALDEAAQPSR